MNILIITLMFIAVFFAAMAQRGKIVHEETQGLQIYRYTYTNKLWYICSFLILSAILFCSKSGTDFPDYIWGYQNWGIEHLKDLGTEWGYTLLVLGLKKVIVNPYVGLGLLKVFTVFLFFKAAYNVRDKINLGMAILSYCMLLYVYSFHLLRMMIAIGIVFVAFSYEINGKEKKCTILLIIAFFFHYTSIIVLFAYLISKAFKRLTIRNIITLLIATTVISFCTSSILQFLVYRVSFFYKYRAYLSLSNSGGIGLVLLYVPILLIIAIRNRKEYEDYMYKLFAIMGIMLFSCSLVGFFLPITRLNYYFYLFFFFYISSIPLRGERIYFSIERRKIGVITVFSVLYYVLFFIYYLQSGGLVSNGLSIYSLFWK